MANSPIMKEMNFADSLRKHISQKGYKAKDFAQQVFDNERAINKYLAGADPAAARLKQMAEFLDIPMDKVYDYDYKDPISILKPDTLELAKMIEKLDDEDFYCVSEMIRVLSKKEKYAKKGDKDAHSSVS